MQSAIVAKFESPVFLLYITNLVYFSPNWKCDFSELMNVSLVPILHSEWREKLFRILHHTKFVFPEFRNNYLPVLQYREILFNL